jgi:hypothetical protein
MMLSLGLPPAHDAVIMYAKHVVIVVVGIYVQDLVALASHPFWPTNTGADKD